MPPRDVAVWRWMRESRSAGSHVPADVPSAFAPMQDEATTESQATPPTLEPTVFRASPPRASRSHHAGPQVRTQPPSDPQRRKEYAKLLGKAKRVERSSPKQAAYLRARARQLEEVIISAPALIVEEPVLGQVDCPAMWRTDSARGLVPVQLVLPRGTGT
jgi:hypothetical protein